MIATLFYLAIQLRQNNAIVRANALAQTNATVTEFQHMVTTDPELTRLYVASPTEFLALSPQEQLRAIFLYRFFFTTREFLFKQHALGLVSDAQWERELTTLSALLTQPHASAYWENRRDVFDADFAAAVDAAPKIERDTARDTIAAMREAILAAQEN